MHGLLLLSISLQPTQIYTLKQYRGVELLVVTERLCARSVGRHLLKILLRIKRWNRWHCLYRFELRMSNQMLMR